MACSAINYGGPQDTRRKIKSNEDFDHCFQLLSLIFPNLPPSHTLCLLSYVLFEGAIDLKRSN